MDHDNPITRIERDFGKARHIGWDFAADNDWRHSKPFLFNSENKPADIFAWLEQQKSADQQKQPSIASEAMFQLENGQFFFFGVGLPLDHRKEVVDKFLAMPHDRPLGKTVDDIRRILGNELPFETKPRQLSLGVGGLWKDVGPVTIWRKGGAKTVLPFQDIEKAQKETGFIPKGELLPLPNPQPKNIMIEAHISVENGTFHCWLGFPVSEQEPGPPARHTLSKAFYDSVANTMVPGIK